MFTPSRCNESIVDLLLRKIERITIRIRTIQNLYQQVNNENLKKRLLNEYGMIKRNFIEIESVVLYIENKSSDDFGFSKLLTEKYRRCEREIFKDKFLFFA